MEFHYNRDKAELLRVMKSKGEKKNICVQDARGKIQITLEPGKFSDGEDVIPVHFRGELQSDSKGCRLKGRFNYGFNLTVLVIVAAMMIVARFVWSVYQNQTDNIALCVVVAVVLAGVVIVANVKAKPAKEMIREFLANLDVKK